MFNFFSKLNLKNFLSYSAFALVFLIFSRFLYFVFKISSLSFESPSLSLAFFAIWGLISLAPGLFLWSCLSPKTSNPFLFPLFSITIGLGATMSFTWILYAIGLYSRLSAFLLLVFYFILGLYGIIRLFKDHFSPSRFSISLSELLVLAFSLFFCEALFESVTGFPPLQWDAVISWDKWASDISQRTFIGGYTSGAYPQGLPLIVSLFYKTLLSPSSSTFLSLPHLLSAGFYVLFPLLLFLSILSFSRQFRINPLCPFLFLIANNVFVLFMIKNSSYADIPLAAVISASIALIAAQSDLQTNSRKSFFISFFFAFFVVCFTKGNGFAFLFIALLLSLFLGFSKNKHLLHPAICAFSLAALFYLHQWFVGSWFPFLSEKSPFHHALSIRSSHMHLIQHGFIHTINQIRIWCNAYNFHSILASYFALLLIISLSILSLIQKKTRLLFVLAGFGLSIWFITSSYDLRNALYLIPVFSLIFPLTISFSFQKYPLIRSHVLILCSLLMAFSAYETRFFQLASNLFSRPSIAPFLSHPVDERSYRTSKLSPENNRFFSSPFAARSPFIICDTPFSRFFTNGVYAYQQNSRYAHTPHSLIIAEPTSYSAVIPDSYLPIARFSQGKFLNQCTLFLNSNQNSFSSIPFSFSPPFLSISIPPSIQGCGIISLYTDISISSHITYSYISPVSIDLLSPSSFVTNLFSPVVIPYHSLPSNTSKIAKSKIMTIFHTDPSATNLTFKLSASSPFSIHRVEIGF